MTETEKLLKVAAELAKGTFLDPTETTVIAIFQRLCCEQDEARISRDMEHAGVLH